MELCPGSEEAKHIQSWLGGRVVRHAMQRLNAGDIRPTLLLDAPDVELTFPGDSSWAGVWRGKQAVRGWLERFVMAGLQIHPDEVIVKGLPWPTTICARGHDHLDVPGEGRVYENRCVIWGRMRCGRLWAYEAYEDTQKARALDAWLLASGRFSEQ